MKDSLVIDNNSGSFKEEKPKRKLNKKILIICSLITILIICSAAGFITVTKSSKIIEDYINLNLSKTAAEFGDSFKYNPFKCSGVKNITCSTDFIEVYQLGQKMSVKNVTLTASPSLNHLKAGVTGNIEVTTDGMQPNDIIKINFNCTDNMTLLSERSLLVNNVLCDSNINNIRSNQQSVFYMKDDIYAQNSSMIGVLKAFVEEKADFMEQLTNFTVIESSSSKIESPALLDDIISVMQLLAKSYSTEIITKESLISLYDSLKSDYNQVKEFYGSNEYTSIVDNTIKAIDGIIYDNNNSISVSVTLKDKEKIDEIFDSEYMKFMLPDYYDISIASSK